MPRTKKSTTRIQLTELVNSYYENKQQENEFKNAAAEQNNEIKKIISNEDQFIKEDGTKHNERTFETDQVIITYYEKDKSYFDEPALIEFLKKKGYTDAVKTKEYVDNEVLHSMIYNEKITKKDLASIDKCRIPKWEPTLTVKAKKKKGE